jgi:iron complex outermembrane receptor protein
MPRLWAAAATATLLAFHPGPAAAQTAPPTASPAGPPVETLPEVDIVAPAPLAARGIDRDKVPGSVQTLTADDFKRLASPYVTNTIFQQVPGITLSDPNGNAAAQELSYRGFFASPLQGTPQGMAVYLNGIRFNEAFGDTINWDLIPTDAIERSDLWTNNPVFGLNALGGAVSLRMKSGFSYQGFESDVQGGSFGHFSGDVQYGARFGDAAAYLAVQGVHEDGWRLRSPADIVRLYGDLGWKGQRAEVHLFTAAASSAIGVAAATPVQLLQRDDRDVFTTPQTSDNRTGLLGLNGKYELDDSWSLQGNLYVRYFQQHHVDGNAAEFERCSSGSSAQFLNHLCLQDDAFPRPNPVTTAFHDQFAILDQNGNPVPCPPGSGNTCGSTPFGTIDRTVNHTTTIGGSLQATRSGNLFDRGNNFVSGASVDHSTINFSADSMLGIINPDLTITTNSEIPGSGAVVGTLGNIGVGPVATSTQNTYYGLYALDTFDVDERLALTAGGRLNVAVIAVSDRLGSSPDLNTSATYAHLNPVTGFTYKITSDLTGYFGYSQANRAPTPLELACSSATKPCLLENFLVADPPLKQVTAATYEAGLRDKQPLGEGRLEWKAALFRTDLSDDIINLGSTIQGRGFFQNVPGTRRQGLEASLQYRSTQWHAYAGYSLIDATYQFSGDLPSPNNPMADANGNVHVTPGRRIPGIPLNQGKLGLEFSPTPRWTLGADIVAVGSRFFIGDDANQNRKLSGYWLANLHASYQLTPNIQLFGLLNNLFDKRYALFGTFFNPQSVANVSLPVVLTDRRSEILGSPLSVYGGLRVTF